MTGLLLTFWLSMAAVSAAFLAAFGMLPMPMSEGKWEALDDLCRLLRDPDEVWVEDRGGHTLDNHKRGLRVWTSNGFMRLRLYKPHAMSFDIRGKLRLRAAMDVATTNQLLRDTTGDSDGGRMS